jgi:hypothetical protein
MTSKEIPNIERFTFGTTMYQDVSRDDLASLCCSIVFVRVFLIRMVRMGIDIPVLYYSTEQSVRKKVSIGTIICCPSTCSTVPVLYYSIEKSWYRDNNAHGTGRDNTDPKKSLRLKFNSWKGFCPYRLLVSKYAKIISFLATVCY